MTPMQEAAFLELVAQAAQAFDEAWSDLRAKIGAARDAGVGWSPLAAAMGTTVLELRAQVPDIT